MHKLKESFKSPMTEKELQEKKVFLTQSPIRKFIKRKAKTSFKSRRFSQKVMKSKNMVIETINERVNLDSRQVFNNVDINDVRALRSS